MANITGKVITVSLSRCKEVECDERWQITRSSRVTPGLAWVPQLAPSTYLFEKYVNNWKGTNPENWWPLYRRQFMEEISSEAKKPILRELWYKLSSGKTIALVCFCPDARYCHRSVVREYLGEHGIEAAEFAPLSGSTTDSDDLSYVTSLF